MMRSGLLWLSERKSIFNFVRSNGLAKKFASRFVAGETLATGEAAAKELQAKGITSSLDLLGESVHAEAEANAARDAYIAILRGMKAAGLEVNASLKPTQMGLDIDEGLAVLRESAARAITRRFGALSISARSTGVSLRDTRQW